MDRQHGHGATTDAGAPRLERVEPVKRDVAAFVREAVDAAGADGVVVSLSGQVASTVAATLAVEALGSGHVTGLVLPAAPNSGDVDDARQVAEELVVDYRIVDVQPLLDRLVDALEEGVVGADPPGAVDAAAVDGAAARLRTAVAYLEADASNRLVLGTADRTRLSLGGVTGHGGADLFPLGDLYTTEVRDLARHMGVRDAATTDPPGLDGLSAETADAVLYHAVERGRSADEVAGDLGIEPGLVRACLRTRRNSRRAAVPTPFDGSDDERG